MKGLCRETQQIWPGNSRGACPRHASRSGSNRNVVDWFQVISGDVYIKDFLPFRVPGLAWRTFSSRGEGPGNCWNSRLYGCHIFTPPRSLPRSGGKYIPRMRGSLSDEDQLLTSFPFSLSRPVIIDGSFMS